MRRGIRQLVAACGSVTLVAALAIVCPCPAPVAASVPDHSCCAPVGGLKAASHDCCRSGEAMGRVGAQPETAPAPGPTRLAGAIGLATPAETIAWPSPSLALGYFAPPVLRI